MATPREIALEHYRQRQLFVAATTEVADQLWSEVDPRNIADSWATKVPEMTAVLSGAQLGAARQADTYLDDVLDAEDLDDTSVGSVDPSAFAGQASDARGLLGLLTNPVVVTLLTIQDGWDVATALGRGRNNLNMLAATQVADAGRLADQVALTARPAATGYVRVAVGNSCARCLLLAGETYQWNTGFQRHPKCDCIHLPAGSQGARLARSPRQIYDRMTAAERSRAGFSKADQKAISDGAELGQVVNAKRGLYTAGGQRFTTEGTTKRGLFRRFEVDPETGALKARPKASTQPRLSVDEIYRVAGGDRDEAIRLLGENAYLRIGEVHLPRRELITLSEPAAAGAAGRASRVVLPTVRPVLEAARTAGAVNDVLKAEIQRIAGKRLHLVSLHGMSAATARETAEGILRGLERFPDVDLREIRLFHSGHEGAYAVADSSRRSIEFSAARTSPAGRKASLEDLARDVDGWDKGVQEFGLGLFKISDFHPRGTGNWTGVAVHEFGHNLDIATLGTAIRADLDDLIARRTAAAMRIPRPHPETPITGPDDLISREISGYATKNRHELVAEAFADVMMNGPAASQLSRGIFDLLEAEYRKGGRRVGVSVISASEPAPNLARLKVAELRALAKERGVTVPARALKADLVRLLAEPVSAAPARITGDLIAGSFDERIGRALTDGSAATLPPVRVKIDASSGSDTGRWKAVEVQGLSGPPSALLSAATSRVRVSGMANQHLRRPGGRPLAEWELRMRQSYSPEMRAKLEAADAAQRAKDVAKAEREIRALDRAMQQSELPSDAVLWRGTFRGDVDFPDSPVGFTWTDPGYVGTSAFRDTAADFASQGGGPLLRILAPQGTSGIRISGGGEAEILLQRGLTFRVAGESTTQVFGRPVRVLDVEVVPASTVADAAANAARRAAVRARQAEIDVATTRADVLAEVDELLARNATPRALAEVIDRAKSLTVADITALRRAAANPAKAQAVLDRIATKYELTGVTRAGDITTMREGFEVVGGRRLPEGAQVRIVRRGTEVVRNGERIVLSRPLVREVTEAELATIRQAAIDEARAFLAATPKPTAAQLRKAGIVKVGTVSKTKTVGFDPETHQVRGGVAPPLGTKVRVVEPGYVFLYRGGGEVLAKPTVEFVRPAAGSSAFFGDAGRRLAELAQEVPVDTRRLGGGYTANTELVTFADGRRAVRKTFDRGDAGLTSAGIRSQIDAEVLGAQVLGALGVQAPAVARAGDNSVLMEFLDGQTWSEHPRYSWGGEIPDDILDLPDVQRMVLADVLMLNTDRNDGNWMFLPDGRIAGIDHGQAFNNPGKTVREALQRYGFLTSDRGDDAVLNFAGVDLADVRGRLAALQSTFEAAGRLFWYKSMMGRMSELERMAKR